MRQLVKMKQNLKLIFSIFVIEDNDFILEGE
jgi:hypothetical protein